MPADTIALPSSRSSTITSYPMQRGRTLAFTLRPRASPAAQFSNSGAEPVRPAEADDEPAFAHPACLTVSRRSRILERDLANQTFAGELVYDVTDPDGRTERLVHHYRFRYLFRFEAEHLLARAGFSV